MKGFTYNTFVKAKENYPELMNELLGVEYVLTQGYSKDIEKDSLRLDQIRETIYTEFLENENDYKRTSKV